MCMRFGFEPLLKYKNKFTKSCGIAVACEWSYYIHIMVTQHLGSLKIILECMTCYVFYLWLLMTLAYPLRLHE